MFLLLPGSNHPGKDTDPRSELKRKVLEICEHGLTVGAGLADLPFVVAQWLRISPDEAAVIWQELLEAVLVKREAPSWLNDYGGRENPHFSHFAVQVKSLSRQAAPPIWRPIVTLTMAGILIAIAFALALPYGRSLVEEPAEMEVMSIPAPSPVSTPLPTPAEKSVPQPTPQASVPVATPSPAAAVLSPKELRLRLEKKLDFGVVLNVNNISQPFHFQRAWVRHFNSLSDTKKISELRSFYSSVVPDKLGGPRVNLTDDDWSLVLQVIKRAEFRSFLLSEEDAKILRFPGSDKLPCEVPFAGLTAKC